MGLKRLLLLSSLLVVAMPAEARMLDPQKAEDAIEIMKRAQCGPADGKPAIYRWSGNIYSRVEGEPDRLLFRGEGMNIRQCVTVTDPQRGTGYRQVSREVMIFLDPVTGEIVRDWKNPFTGETVKVMQINNDPVNMPPMFPLTTDGKNAMARLVSGYKRMGPWLMMPYEAPLFYTNPLAGDFQEFVGNKYHAMEVFDFVAPAAEILDTRIPFVKPSVSWVRISDWMPWMKMRGRQGQMVFNAVGTKMDSFDELPAVLRDEIDRNFPIYRQPPPLDDARPNETTWTVFKKWVESGAAGKPAASAAPHQP